VAVSAPLFPASSHKTAAIVEEKRLGFHQQRRPFATAIRNLKGLSGSPLKTQRKLLFESGENYQSLVLRLPYNKFMTEEKVGALKLVSGADRMLYRHKVTVGACGRPPG